MSRLDRITPKFVEEVPRELEDGVLYISVEYATVVHRCCCGCGAEVVTPMHPTRWALTWDGETVSLAPSVGSWALPCRSHYVIRKNAVRWARSWSSEEVAAGRRRDRALVDSYYNDEVTGTEPQPGTAPGLSATTANGEDEPALQEGTTRPRRWFWGFWRRS